MVVGREAGQKPKPNQRTSPVPQSRRVNPSHATRPHVIFPLPACPKAKVSSVFGFRIDADSTVTVRRDDSWTVALTKTPLPLLVHDADDD